MDIILSNSSDKPIYEQIASQVKAQILSGTLAAGAKLPSIRALASDLGVSVITTKRAYADLEQLGRHARQAARDARPGSPRNHAVAICKKGYTMHNLLELKGA